MITEVDARRQGLDGTAGKHPFVLGGARRKTRDVVPICIEKIGGTVPIILIYIYAMISHNYDLEFAMIYPWFIPCQALGLLWHTARRTQRANGPLGRA